MPGPPRPGFGLFQGAPDEPLPRSTDLLQPAQGALRRRPRHGHRRRPHLGAGLSRPLGARQDRALHARHQLHRLVLVEDLREGRHRHLGDAADRLSAHAPRPAQPRAARLLARRELQLVSVQRQPSQVPDGARAPDEGLAGRARGGQDAGRCLGEHRGERGHAARLPAPARHGRIRARRMGRGERDRRRRQRVHDPQVRAGPRGRLLAHPGDVDDLLRSRRALPVADRRHLHELLRLVLRPPALEPADLGRADRRARVGRLVQLHLPDRVGLERAADAHAGRALLHRGALQGRQGGGHHPRLRRGVQARRPVAASQAGHRCGAGDGDGPRDPEGVLLRPAVGLFRRLRAPLHRPAAAGAARSGHARRRHDGARARALPAGGRLRRRARAGQQPRLEDGGLRRVRRRGGAQRLDRLSLGQGRPLRCRQVEPGGSRGPPRAQREAAPVAARGGRPGPRGGHRGLPVLRRHRYAAFRCQRAGQRHPAPARAGRAAGARTRRRAAGGAGGHGVRPAGGPLWRGARPGRRDGRRGLRQRRALHPGLAGGDHRSAACAGDRGGASSPTTPTRRRGARW